MKIERLLLKVVRLPVKVLRYLETLEKLTHCTVGEDVILYPECRISNHQGFKSAITIGDHSRVLGQLDVLAHGGRIKIGESCFVGEHSRIWSADSIVIGSRVLISHNVNIHDHNAHSLSANRRHWHFNQIFSKGHPKILDDVGSVGIVIEDDVWIGFDCIILKGVTIGKGAVIGAGTVVSKDVSPYTVVVGNPPRVIGSSTP